MRRDEMYLGMTIIFKSLQEKAFNFQDYRAEGIDSLKSAAELGHPLRNLEPAVNRQPGYRRGDS